MGEKITIARIKKFGKNFEEKGGSGKKKPH